MIVVVVLLFFPTIPAQLRETDLRKLIAAGTWSPDELKALENGDVVVRSLQTGMKQELASIGILRIKNLPPVSMDKLRESLSQRGSDEKKTGGQFSEPPTLDDLRPLELETDAIDQLQKCSVGRCDLNLSAKMISRFGREIDWTSSNARSDATRLIAEMLVDYVREYAARGDGALGTYDNRRKTVDLSASHRSLLSSSSLIRDLAPEFIEYLEKFPRKRLENVTSSMHWSVIDFGLKPSITISHSAAYTQKRGESEQLFVASKQIYSSRYLDSSLTFTMLLRVVTDAGVDSYLVFVDRSRSDALDGPLGGFARDIVQKEALGRIETLLSKAHLRLLTVQGAETKATADSPEGSSVRWIAALRRRSVVITIAGVIVAVAFLLLWNQRRASRSHRRQRG